MEARLTGPKSRLGNSYINIRRRTVKVAYGVHVQDSGAVEPHVRAAKKMRGGDSSPPLKEPGFVLIA